MKNTKLSLKSWKCSVAIAAMALSGAVPVLAAVTASFDDLPTPPPLDGATGLFYANSNSSSYLGITWDDRFTVVGAAARTDTVTPGPLFGIPHSGDYFVTNDGTSNDGLTITTSMVLTGAWFGRNEYYGFGAGADQVTINAMQGATVLASVVFDLPPPAVAGQPGVMGFVDTQSFEGLTGLTGYRIDRHETQALQGNWVADDFSFESAPVPEPSSLALLVAGMAGLAGAAAFAGVRGRKRAAATCPR